ncbi:hypothetical protein J4E83_003585 [Alternaria metachromatica]|uniref:uncharacterized protein n=1 Tax=Alternaria metachromatica TaxID=283354 RepID=UPI0020C520FA|nr:uncharacterized protein J4E83_003585 [Alternaria metachromatica]KAI4626435.1 hypothetical protein J4E83_003585 [Alternaria metachromatica]
MTERKSSGKPQHSDPRVKRGTRLISRSPKTSANNVVTPPKAAVAAPNARKDEIHRRRYPFNDMLKRKSEGAVDLERDTAPSGPSNELYSKSEMASSGDDAVDARMAHRIADLERALAIAKEEQNLAREELSRLRQCREADQDAIEELRAQLAQSASNADTVPPVQLEQRLASHDKTHQNRLERPQSNGEADDLRLRLHAAEKESQERLQQLLALKSSISSLTRMDSQITDSELAESFSQLANRVREWTVSNFRRSKLNLDSLPKETEEVLSALNPLYSVNIRSTDKLALYQAVVSNSLMQIFDAPIVFGLPSTGPFGALRPFVEHTRHLGTTYREWVRATVQVLERSEANGDIETEREASLHRLTGEISHILFTLTSVSLPQPAQSVLTGILKDAMGLQRTLALQKARYQLLFFRCQDASMQFDDRTMEAVNDVDPAVEDGADMDVDRRFLFCAFPGLVKWGDEWGEHAEMSNVLLKARVCSGVNGTL